MSSNPTRSFKRLASSWLARLARRPKLTPEQLLALRPRCILIVRQHNQMGDMVCATPALRAIRETWPAAEIALVTAPVNRGVVAHNPHLDRPCRHRYLRADRLACRDGTHIRGILGPIGDERREHPVEHGVCALAGYGRPRGRIRHRDC